MPKGVPKRIEAQLEALKSDRDRLIKEVESLQAALKGSKEPQGEIGKRLKLLEKRLEVMEKQSSGLSQVLNDFVKDQKGDLKPAAPITEDDDIL